MTYESVERVESKVAEGVVYSVAKMSFARRMELMKRVRELARRAEFLAAGEDMGEKMDAALLEVGDRPDVRDVGIARSHGPGCGWRPRDAANPSRSPGRKNCFARPWPRCARPPGFRTPNEKTNRRLPFSLLKPSRLEVRRVP